MFPSISILLHYNIHFFLVLHLTTLETRCIRGDLTETFIIMKGLEDLDYSRFFSLSGGVLWENLMKLFKPRCHTNLHKNILSNRVVFLWNDLDQDIIDSIAVDYFKNKLDNFLKRRDWYLFNFLPSTKRVPCTLLAWR